MEETIHIMSNAVANGLAGAGGGIIAQIITYPLQTVHNPTPTALSHIMQYSLFLSNSSGGYTVCRWIRVNKLREWPRKGHVIPMGVRSLPKAMQLLLPLALFFKFSRFLLYFIFNPLMFFSSREKREENSPFSPFLFLFGWYQVIRTEGWGGLYSGLKPSLLGTAASQVGPFSFLFESITVSYLFDCLLLLYLIFLLNTRNECLNDKSRI